LSTTVETFRSATIFHVTGEIDMSTVAELEKGLERAIGLSEVPPGIVIVDFRGITFLGAEGLRVVVAAQNKVASTGVSIRVVAPPGGGMIRRLLDLSGVGVLLDLYDSLEAALPPESH